MSEAIRRNPEKQPTTPFNADFDTIPLADMPTNVRVCEQNIRLNGWMLGGMLQSAKKRLPHGTFMDWLKAHTDLSQTTANDLMNLYDGVQQTPFLGEIRQSAALALLALAPEDREQFAEHHDVEALTVRRLREEIAQAKRVACEQTALLTAEVEAHGKTSADLAEALQGKEAAEAEADRATEFYDELNDRFTEAQDTITVLKRTIEETPPPALTPVEIEIEKPVFPPDYEQTKAELERAVAYADRMEQEARKAQTELRKRELEDNGETGFGANSLQRITMHFLGQTALYLKTGSAAGFAGAKERKVALDCVTAVEDWCREARKALESEPVMDVTDTMEQEG